jgi:AcrR family transcriptional regulator
MNQTRPKTPRKRPSQERSRVTVDAILEATTRILQKEGYEAASTNRIAREAGVSVGSFYQYFPTREAVMADLADRQADKMLGLLARELATLSMAPLEEAIRIVVKTVCETVAEDALLNRVLLRHLASIGRMDKLIEMERRAAQLIRVYLEVHRDRVRLRNPDVASLILVHLSSAMTDVFIAYHPDELDYHALAEEMTDLVLRYVMKAPPADDTSG